MFRLFSCCGKKSTAVIDVVGDKSVAASDAPAVTAKNNGKIPWRYRLFGRPLTKINCIKNEKQSIITDSKPKKTATKPRWWCSWKKRCKVAPSPEEQSREEESDGTPHQAQVVDLQGQAEEEEQQTNDCSKTLKTLRHQQFCCLGLPNPVQICYMNSCLQSLLTLEDFIRDLDQQEQVWSLDPDSTIIKALMDISRSHFSVDRHHKLCLLAAFKKAVSLWNPEFKDLHQKDAHEFLTSVLDQMRCLGQQLQVLASSIGSTYSCPVEGHLVFKMQNTRTCKSCGAESTREEEFTHLSLDLVPAHGTVQQMLEHYLIETELDFTCECGATTSGQRSSFINLPRVLVLHLKRFRFSPTLELTKDNDPVVLSRDLVVPSSQGGGCYSLVSTINHIGGTVTSGHYISDGVDPDVGQEDPTDRWFTYNDAVVTETSGASVCERRERFSYILFYTRRD
ncbi:ubiquitin carboxyl-terminal hydrolase 37-like isoform X2 [Trachinotus anak]|uniref:ubiquitin carboxyl-terminal hydrolase 37-like isoform X2 n=2 Tax=Trachinotus anak TaxID=443729 RepID=UPI0039F20B8C